MDSLSILCIYAAYILLLALNYASNCATLVNNLAQWEYIWLAKKFWFVFFLLLTYDTVYIAHESSKYTHVYVLVKFKPAYFIVLPTPVIV